MYLVCFQIPVLAVTASISKWQLTVYYCENQAYAYVRGVQCPTYIRMKITPNVGQIHIYTEQTFQPVLVNRNHYNRITVTDKLESNYFIAEK